MVSNPKNLKPKQKEEMEEIDRLVFQFQEGDWESGEEVLRLFGCHPDEPFTRYVGKFYHMLRYGRFSFSDRESRKIISCFVSDPLVRKNLHKAYQYGDTRQKAYDAVKSMMGYVESIPDEDLKQELRTLFIQQMKRYKKKKKDVFFAGYIYNSYGYAVLNFLNSYVKKSEPYHIKYKKPYLIPLDEAYVEENEEGYEINERLTNQTLILQEDEVIGNSWIRGLTCGEEFQKLSMLQRLIIKFYYEDDLTDGKIAKQMNMHINTIHKQRKKGIQLIEEEIKRIQKEGYGNEENELRGL